MIPEYQIPMFNKEELREGLKTGKYDPNDILEELFERERMLNEAGAKVK